MNEYSLFRAIYAAKDFTLITLLWFKTHSEPDNRSLLLGLKVYIKLKWRKRKSLEKLWFNFKA